MSNFSLKSSSNFGKRCTKVYKCVAYRIILNYHSTCRSKFDQVQRFPAESGG